MEFEVQKLLHRFVTGDVPSLRYTCAAILLLRFVPHCLYFILWTYPAFVVNFCRWRKIVPTKSAAIVASIIRTTEFALIFSGWIHHGTIAALTPLVLGVAAICVGQFLNVHVHRKLGVDGIYYGIKLGRPIPWVYDWVFDNLTHPQYIGMTIWAWGIALVFPCTESLLSAVITGPSFLCTVLVESHNLPE
mmetsp:Transcript_21734/g.35946  ORF Transcript_21734/g.35946 Transcript_21734/m.35946 type:complete len:190 (+) Transcript_21734:176-745(+)